MPKRKRYYKRKKRKFRKKRYAKRRRYRIPPAILNRTTRRFRIVTRDLSMTSTSGNLTRTYVRANDMVDPLADIVTAQKPLAWESWKVFFNHYVVLGSRINLYFTAQTADTRGIVGVNLIDSKNVTYADTSDYMEQKRSRFGFFNHSNKAVKLSKSFSARKFFNVKDVKDNVDRLGADILSSPTDLAFYHIMWQADGTSTKTVHGTVVLDLICLFSEPRLINHD